MTVLTAYNADGKMATLTAVNPSTGNQVTTYAYGTSLATSAIARADLLAQEICPQGMAGTGSVSYAYDGQGRVISKTDQNGSLHEYLYDNLGRLGYDLVHAPVSGVDATVRSINWLYDPLGQVQTIASCNLVTVVNEVTYQYNAFGQVITEYQEHGGAVNTSTTPCVQYEYADGSQGHIRPTAVVYPNGRTVTYNYNGGSDDLANRVSFLADGAVSAAERRQQVPLSGTGR